jgi:ubiquinone/menaquinone biosynthesis C-methylase UbiE
MLGQVPPMSAYDPVATLYDRAFADIRVRRAEWRWLNRRLDALPFARPRVLEIGCGTGALLRALAPRIAQGIGLDVSTEMLRRARARCADTPALGQLSFLQIDSSTLPLPDHSVELAISFLSFRYLDWPTIWAEIRRVLVPGGHFLMIDMVQAQATARDLPGLLRSSARQLALPLTAPGFARDLRALTSHPEWRVMLQRHPARPLADYRRFCEQHLPERSITTLDIGRTRRVIALESGALW